MPTDLREPPQPVVVHPAPTQDVTDAPAPRRVRESLAIRPAAGPVEAPPPRRGGPRLTRLQRLTRRAVTWYARHELPRYGHLLNRWGINRQPDWAAAGIIETRDRFHGLWMRLDLADFFQRIDAFFGCYHELEVLAALDVGVHPGDVFLDAGANIGLVSLHGCGRAGPGGLVLAFEPNPAAARRLRWHAARNLLPNLRCYEAGLSDRAERLTLRVPGAGNLGAGTLGPIPERYHGEVGQSESVLVARGDDVLDQQDERPLFIKLDVEGFELRAINGLADAIAARRPAILTEVNGEMLEINGASPRGVFDRLAPLGYELFALDRHGFRRRRRLTLHPLTREQIDLEKDVLFLHPRGPHWARFKPFMSPPGRYWRHLCPATC